MTWITVRLSPEAKHAWRWFHTQLGAVIAFAPMLYEHVDLVQDYVSPKGLNYVMTFLGVLVVWNTIRRKKEK